MDIKVGISYEAACEVMFVEEIKQIFGEEIFVSDVAGYVIKIYDNTCRYVENKKYVLYNSCGQEEIIIFGGSRWAKSFHDPCVETRFIVLPNDKTIGEIKAIISSLIAVYGEDKTIQAVELWEKSRKA